MLNFGDFLNATTNIYNGLFGQNAARNVAKNVIASQIARTAGSILPGLARPAKSIAKDVLDGKAPTAAAVEAAFEAAKPTLISKASDYLKRAVSDMFNRIMGPIISLVVGIFSLFSKMFSTVGDAFNAEDAQPEAEAQPGFISTIWSKLSNVFAPEQAARPDVEDAYDSELEDDAGYETEEDNGFDFEPEDEAPAPAPAPNHRPKP